MRDWVGQMKCFAFLNRKVGDTRRLAGCCNYRFVYRKCQCMRHFWQRYPQTEPRRSSCDNRGQCSNVCFGASYETRDRRWLSQLEESDLRESVEILRKMRVAVSASAICVLVVLCLHAEPQQNPPLAEAAAHSLQQSQLTLPGSPPFYLQAEVSQPDQPDKKDFTAKIEELWDSPQKWRRTIQSPSFSETLIVNGEETYEHHTGEYYPWWLRDVVTALFEPTQMLPKISQAEAQAFMPPWETQRCAKFPQTVGAPPQENTVFTILCLDPTSGLLGYLVAPLYAATFGDYSVFHDKQVARHIFLHADGDNFIDAHVTELGDLTNTDIGADLGDLTKPDARVFVVPRGSRAQDQVKTVSVADVTARTLAVSAPAITWPPVREGKTEGVLSVLISVDRSGVVRETRALNSDNPRLSGFAHGQVMAWRFKPLLENGMPVQMETILTLPFATHIENPIPVLSDAEARKQASQIGLTEIPAGLAPKGTTIIVRLHVSSDGSLSGVQPVQPSVGAFTKPLVDFLVRQGSQWHFRPLVNNGKPDIFYAEIVFYSR